MDIIIKDGKQFLESDFPTGNHQYCAKIVGICPQWGLKREWINKSRQGLKLYPVQEGEIIEHVRASHSGKNKDYYYYKVSGETLVCVTKKEVLLKFT